MQQEKQIGKFEKKVLSAVFLALFIPIFFVQTNVWYKGHGDNAFIGELMHEIVTTGKPNIKITAGFYHLFTLCAMKPDEVLKQKLEGPNPKKWNQFRKHTYLILYPISLLTKVISSKHLIPLLKTLSFLVLIFLIYGLARSYKIDVITSIAVCLFISIHPAWSWGLYYGEMYVDRLFLPLGLLFIILLNRTIIPIKSLVFVVFLCALISERVGAICGIAIIGQLVLNWKNIQQTQRKQLFSIAIIAILFSVILLKFYIQNSDYASFSSSFSVSGFLSLLQDFPGFATKLWVFMFLNILIYGIFGCFNWKYTLITLGVMLPNIMGNIGGAEKTGWSTHYHTLYFPFLAFTVVSGFGILYNKLIQLKKPRSNIIGLNIVTVALFCVVAAMSHTAPLKFDFSQNPFKKSALALTYTYLPLYMEGGGFDTFVNDKIKVDQSIPKGVVVTTVSHMYTALYEGREMYQYPAGVGIADYVVLPHRDNVKPRFFGAVNYNGAEATKQLDIGLFERLRELKFDLDNPVIIGPWAVLKKRELK